MAVQRGAGPARTGHLDRQLDGLVEVGGRRGSLGSRSSQTLQIADHARAVERSLADRVDRQAGGGRLIFGMQQLRLADDRSQHVVEVVRDAGGHLADRAQLFGVEQLGIQPPRLGDVGVDVDPADDFADQAAHRRGVALHDARRIGGQLPFAFVDLGRVGH